jgi:hypothetical protein
MTTETVPSRPFFQVREKRKFNWLVLGLLLLVVAAFVAGMLLPL